MNLYRFLCEGRIHPGLLMTDNGFWDTFRTVYPMLGLLYPDMLGAYNTKFVEM